MKCVILGGTELSRLRVAANLQINEASIEAEHLLGECSMGHWVEMEAGKADVPPALLERFRVLAARAERQQQRGNT